MLQLIDTAELIYAHLAAQADLVAEITDAGAVVHLYGPPGLPPNWDLTKGLMFVREGGAGNEDLPLVYERFQFRCYAPTSFEASQVYRKLFDALIHTQATPVTITGGQGLIQYARLVMGPYDNVDPQVEWPYIMTTWEFHAGQYLLP